MLNAYIPWMPSYPTYDDAETRVTMLRRYGIWPGIKRQGERFTLTTNPQIDGSLGSRHLLTI